MTVMIQRLLEERNLLSMKPVSEAVDEVPVEWLRDVLGELTEPNLRKVLSLISSKKA